MKKQIILISGASSKLGVPLVGNLEERGYRIYAGIRDEKKLRTLGQKWKISHPDIIPIKLDITNDLSCKLAIEGIIKREKRIDVIINCAVLIPVKPTLESTSDEFLDTLNTNTVGAFRLSKAAIPNMIVKKYGKIINITSTSGIVAVPKMPFYCASKFALTGLGNSLRYEFAKYNVWITNLAPGIIAGVDQKEKYALIKRILFGKCDYLVIADKIDKIIQSKSPAADITIGLYAKVSIAIEGLMHNNINDIFLRYTGTRRTIY